jgi:hypothetical protein
MADQNPFSPTRLPIPSASTASSIPSTIPQPKMDPNRRRSLLLPRGTLVAAAQRGEIGPSSPSPSKLMRPTTMFGGDMQSLAALSARFAEEDETETGSDGQEDARAAAHARLTGERGPAQTQAKSKLGVFRSQSLRKGPPETTRTTTTRSHTRNTSTTSGLSSRPLSTLTESRRPSRPDSVASTSSIKSATESTASRTKLPTNPNTNTALRRPPSTTSRHTRTQSALPTSSGIALPRPTDFKRQASIAEGVDPFKRPAFSTLQQHYSPRKNSAPKPASSTLIHPPSAVDVNSALPLDIQFLQARLLQLSILHRDFSTTQQAWEDDAKVKLQKKFDVVAQQCDIVQSQERDVRKNINIHVLQEWGAGDSGLLAENVRLFSSVVQEVLCLVETDGRVQQVLDVFEAWIEYVDNIWSTRHISPASSGETEFIDSLGEAWRSECRALMRRLGALGRVLDGLEKPGEGSSLSALMQGAGDLRKGAVEELGTVLKLEGDIVLKEGAWVTQAVAALEVHP